MCHKYHVKHISKQCNLDRLKSGSERDTNETPTCAVPMHAPQTNTLWWGEERGTTKAPLYTLPRHVGFGCLRVLMKWVEWMWRVALSLATVGASPGVRPGQAFYRQRRDGYEVQLQFLDARLANPDTLSFGDFQPQNLNCTRKSARKLQAHRVQNKPWNSRVFDCGNFGSWMKRCHKRVFLWHDAGFALYPIMSKSLLLSECISFVF